MTELDLTKRVATLLDPLRSDKEALREAITIHLHENVLRVLNGGDDPLDVIETELRHQAQALIDPEGNLLKKVSTLADFIEQDIKHRLQQAAQEGLDARQKVGAIAEEASLDIHQLLSAAKKDLPTEVRPLLNPKIETLEATYSTAVIQDKLRAYLGLDFIGNILHQLQQAVVDAQQLLDPSKLASRVQTLSKSNGELIDTAIASVDKQFKNERIRKMVKSDLEKLHSLYCDQASIEAKLSPFQ